MITVIKREQEDGPHLQGVRAAIEVDGKDLKMSGEDNQGLKVVHINVEYTEEVVVIMPG